jgi:hypothetical protein
MHDDAVAQDKMLKKMLEAKSILMKKLKESGSPPPKTNRLHAPNSVWQLKDFI